MKLSISNIAWDTKNNDFVYRLIRDCGYSGLEIAPTKVFPEKPYDHLSEAAQWQKELQNAYGFQISSMQSIWYGRSESIFGVKSERDSLTAYTKKAIDFAETIGCKNLVFGCPKNRNLPEGADASSAVDFFREIGEYAYEHHTVIGMEANPPIYNTNFINTTSEALELIRKVNSKGFLLNLDVGTMIESGENVEILEGAGDLINHVHISEPYLKPLEMRDLHTELIQFLKAVGYTNYISIEMGMQEELHTLEERIKYVRGLVSDETSK